MSAPNARDQDRAFLQWLRNPDTLPADLRAKWHELAAVHMVHWQMVAIERELTRRGERLP